MSEIRPAFVLISTIIIVLLFASSFIIISHTNYNTNLPLNPDHKPINELATKNGTYIYLNNKTYYIPNNYNGNSNNISLINNSIHTYSITPDVYYTTDSTGTLLAHFNVSLVGFSGNSNYYTCEMDISTVINNYSTNYDVYCYIGQTVHITAVASIFSSSTKWFIFWSGISFASNLSFSPGISAKSTPSDSPLNFLPSSLGFSTNQSGVNTGTNTFYFDVQYTPNAHYYTQTFSSSSKFNLSIGNQNVENTNLTTIELQNGSYYYRYVINNTVYSSYLLVNGNNSKIILSTYAFGVPYNTESILFIIMTILYVMLFSRYASSSFALIGTIGLFWLYAGYIINIEYFTLNTFILIAFVISMFFGYKFYSGEI